jgi:hypothetical protein
MTNTLKATLTILFLSVFCLKTAIAQEPLDKSKWRFEAKKKSGNQYELIFHLTLPKGWHIFSLTPGGDGSLIAPSFVFDTNSHLTLIGKVTEKGDLIREKMEGITGMVRMYEGGVDYIQRATITTKDQIAGTLTYQICNDKMCLPPKDKSFVFEME